MGKNEGKGKMEVVEGDYVCWFVNEVEEELGK